jgi:hypothetical protein
VHHLWASFKGFNVFREGLNAYLLATVACFVGLRRLM